MQTETLVSTRSQSDTEAFVTFTVAGQLFGVPVIRVGEHAMTGWDKAEFERLLSGRFKRR